MANPILISIAAQHRLEMLQLSNMSAAQMNSALIHAQTMNDTEWAKFVRSTFTEIIVGLAPLAAAISAEFFDTTRSIWIAQYGIQKVASFAAEPALVMPFQEQIIETRRKELGHYINQTFEGQLTRMQIATPARQLSASAVADHDREEQKVLAETDDFAQTTRRVVRGEGCIFCKTKSIISYGNEFGLSDEGEPFHKGCGCSLAVEFDGGDPDAYWQDWMDDFQDELTSARDSLNEQREAVGYGDHYDARRTSAITGRELKPVDRQFRPEELSLTTSNLLREVRANRSGKSKTKADNRVDSLKENKKKASAKA